MSRIKKGVSILGLCVLVMAMSVGLIGCGSKSNERVQIGAYLKPYVSISQANSGDGSRMNGAMQNLILYDDGTYCLASERYSFTRQEGSPNNYDLSVRITFTHYGKYEEVSKDDENMMVNLVDTTRVVVNNPTSEDEMFDTDTLEGDTKTYALEDYGISDMQMEIDLTTDQIKTIQNVNSNYFEGIN